MRMKSHCCLLAAFLLIAILPPALAMEQTDEEKARDALAKCKEKKCEEAITLAGQINDADLKKKTLQQIEDQKKANDAIEKSGAGKPIEALDTAAKIEDPKMKKGIMGEIGDEAAAKFWSNFGVGLIANFALGHKPPVKSASIINGIVRVDKEEKLKYGLGLEVHKFLVGTSWGASRHQPFSGAIAVGPYISVLAGTNSIVDAFGAGFILGIYGRRSSKLMGEGEASKVPPESIASKLSLNLCVGGFADPGTQVLADNFEENKPPPDTETTVRYKDITQYGLQIALSFSYDF